MAGVAGLVLFELHVPGARSLKEKRRVVKSLVERIAQRHRVSTSEVGLHDLHQRSEIALALVGSDARTVEQHLERIRSAIELDALGCVLTRWDAETIDLDASY